MWAPKRLHIVSGIMALQILGAGSADAQNYSNRDYCLSSGRIRLLLVDITTEYDQTDKDSIVGMIDNVLSEATGGDLIVVRTISDSHTKSERLVERCVPQCPAQGVVNRLFKCSDGLLRTDTVNVRQDILAALRGRLANFQELKYSDIIRTINSDAEEEAKQGQVLNLYIYSDLIENSEDLISDKNFFHYKIPFLIDALKKYKLIAPLPNSGVQVAGVGRSDASDRRPLNINDQNFLLAFWKAYFKAGGAVDVTISQRARE
jgi:hypothetical protein